MRLYAVRLKDVQRFWKHTRVSETREYNGTPCIEWTASLFQRKGGYGQFSVGSKKQKTYRNWRVHRWAYLVFIGEIEGAGEYEHLCSNPACVNVWAHAEIVTHDENQSRKWERIRKALAH